jgi:arsenate reductase
MKNLFICYTPCTTCQSAKKWLDDNKLLYDSRDIKLNNPSINELECFYKRSGLPLKRFFNTSGQRYRELALTDKLASMSEEEQLNLLSTDGMLVKRPILVCDDFVLVGFKKDEWSQLLTKGS